MLSNENIVMCWLEESEAFGYFKRETVSSISNKSGGMSIGRLILEQSCVSSVYIFKRLHKALQTSWKIWNKNETQ